MKATIEIDAALYRRLKAEAALRGCKIKDMVTDGIRRVLKEPAYSAPAEAAAEPMGKPAWFGGLRQYAKNANGKHDLAAMRASVARARRVGGA